MKVCKICGHEALKNHVEQYHKILTEYNKTASYEAKTRAELNKEIKKLAGFINVASFENPMNLGPDKERLEGLKNELASLGEAFDVYDIKGGDLVAFKDPSAERGIFSVVEDNGDSVVIKSMSGGSTQTVSRDQLLNASQDSPELAIASGESRANELRDGLYGRIKDHINIMDERCKYCGWTASYNRPENLDNPSHHDMYENQENEINDHLKQEHGIIIGEAKANEVDGDYIFQGQKIGRVTDLNTKKWFGKVELDAMPEFAEYGDLDPSATVEEMMVKHIQILQVELEHYLIV